MFLNRKLLLAFSLAAAAAVLLLSQGLTAQDKNIAQASQAARDIWKQCDTARAQKKWDVAIKGYEKSLEVMKAGMISGRTLDTLSFGQGAKNMIEFCQAMPVDVKTLADGTYEGKAFGFAGDIVAEVTLEKGRIKTMRIKSQKESSPRQALNTVPAQIVRLQSPNVEAFSGATVTSYGIMTATLHALQQGKPAEAKTK